MSDSSADYDRGQKFAYYRKLPSVREYLIVAQDRPHVTRARRYQTSDLFRIDDIFGLEETVELESIGVTLTLPDIYRGVDFPTKA